MTILAQQVAQTIDVPQFAWAAISPHLVLFGMGILVLLLETAGDRRVPVSFMAAGALIAGAVFAGYQTDEKTLPAIVALVAVATAALTWIWRDRPRMLSAILTGFGFVGAAAAAAWQWVAYSGGLLAVPSEGDTAYPLVRSASVIGDMVAIDGVSLFTIFTICVAGLLTVPLGYAYADSRRMHRGEYYPLLLFASTGMALLGASADFIMVFISVEILSLSLYILTAFARRDLVSQEAAFKYFLLGAFSSALLLYGIAVAYGVAGTTNIARVGAAFAALDAPQTLVLAAMALLLVGFGFKTAIVPFHMWTPDVYQGAPTPVTGFMAAATKAAAFAAFVRVFVGALGGLQWSWVPVFWVLAVLTMLVGAVLAVVQRDIKRMLGYSAIAHAGYLLLGLTAVSREGVSSVLLYLMIYGITSVGAFGVLSLFERRTSKAMALDDLRGLGRRYPVPSVMLALFLLSLAGIPGTAGFIAKLAVFRSAMQAEQEVLVIAAILSSVIAFVFYLRVIVAMFMEETEEGEEEGPELVATTGQSAGLGLAAAAVIVLGIPPGVGLLIGLARQVALFAG